MIGTIRKMLTLFDRKERRNFSLLMVLMVFVALAEIVGISSVLMFLRVLADPAQISENGFLSALNTRLGFDDSYDFQLFLSVVVFLVVLVSLVIKAGGAYVMIKFATMRGYSLSTRLLQTYLHRPYSWFLQQNSADIAKNVLGEVDNLIIIVVVPLLRFISGSISTLAIVSFLLIVDPYVSILSALVLGSAYALLYLSLRKTFQRLGKEMLAANRERYRLVGEATGGFKQVKLSGLEERYTDRFRGPARERAENFSLNQILSELPRFALEAMTFGLLLTLILVLLLRNDGNLAATIPTLGIFAFAVMRLLPAVQQVYFSLVSVRSGDELLKQMIEAYRVADLANGIQIEGPPPTSDILPFKTELALDSVGFGYPNAEKRAVENLSLSIPAGSKVGVVGGTGAGKTTVIDIILGLLPVQAGALRVDGVEVTEENRRAWQNAIGYVPQDIYLTDTSIAHNIAFGLPDDEIDMQAVETAARIAALHDFVVNELPEGYQTIVGERGVRLSGGQRQRIGIARALYGNPSLLIMDEATSALDNITERVVMEAVHNIQDDKTIILIAHRLSTVKECDQIFLMERGKVGATGTYEELVSQNETFREMAKNT